MRDAKGNFSDDIAIDLGTANTLVHVDGKGVVIDEPSIVAISSQRGAREVLAVGMRARQLIGRTPENIQTLRPMRDGVIADFIATEEMLRQFIKRARSMFGFRGPRILVCVPAGATPVERRAVYQTAMSAGARKAFLIEEPVAASIGAGLPVDDPGASMVVDMGGGTTDIAVLTLGSIVQARSLRVAGNAMDEAIIRHVRRRHQLLIGEASAERIKIEAGTAATEPNGLLTEVHIRGRDLRTKKLKSVVLTSPEIGEALADPVESIADFIQRSVEDLPAEVQSDISHRGIYLTGGGALLTKLDRELERRIGVKFHVPREPMQCVIKGSAIVLSTLAERGHLLIQP